jgi:hypothetical protein
MYSCKWNHAVLCLSLVPMSSNFSVSTRRLCVCFLFIKSPVVLSLFTKLWILWLLELFHDELYVEIFADTFKQFRIWHRCHTEVHVALKYTALGRTTLLTNCNWEQMARGADNCCLLLTNNKQTPSHEPHCSPWNILPSSGSLVNYFPSFEMLPAIRHADSSEKFICASRQTAPLSPWNRSTKLKNLGVVMNYSRELFCYFSGETEERYEGP